MVLEELRWEQGRGKMLEARIWGLEWSGSRKNELEVTWVLAMRSLPLWHTSSRKAMVVPKLSQIVPSTGTKYWNSERDISFALSPVFPRSSSWVLRYLTEAKLVNEGAQGLHFFLTEIFFFLLRIKCLIFCIGFCVKKSQGDWLERVPYIELCVSIHELGTIINILVNKPELKKEELVYKLK